MQLQGLKFCRQTLLLNITFLFSPSNHMTKVYEKMFPDSKIEKRFACSRTKTACILNDATMPPVKAYLTAYIKINTFTIANDGSSDTGIEKINTACTHMFNVERSDKVQVKFFNIGTTSGEHCSATERLFNAIDNLYIG